MKRLFWDIETSPDVALTWRVGRKVNLDYKNIINERAIICVAWKWQGEKVVHALTWDKGDDRKLVRKFADVALQADEMVAHNGDKFDAPWLNTRNAFHNLPPLPISKTVDTLAIARKRFLFNSNRLDYLAQFLGIGGKVKTEFDLWRQVCLSHCPKSLAKMVSYCKHDVQLLEKVWQRLEKYHAPKSHAGMMGGLDAWSCPRCTSTHVSVNKHKITAHGWRQHQFHCCECGGYYTVNDRAYSAYLKGKQ